MDLGWLKSLFRPKPIIDDFEAVRRGRQRLRGRLKAGPDELRSPIKNVVCLAFYYRAYYAVQGRTGWIERTLKAVEVHAPLFYLEMNGGTLRVVSDKTASFRNADHRELAGRGFPTFKAEEQAVRPGTRVSIHGKVQQTAEGLAVRPEQIHVLEDDRPKMPTRRREPRRVGPSRPAGTGSGEQGTGRAPG